MMNVCFIPVAHCNNLISARGVEAHCIHNDLWSRPGQFFGFLVIVIGKREGYSPFVTLVAVFLSCGKNELLALVDILKMRETSIPFCAMCSLVMVTSNMLGLTGGPTTVCSTIFYLLPENFWLLDVMVLTCVWSIEIESMQYVGNARLAPDDIVVTNHEEFGNKGDVCELKQYL